MRHLRIGLALLIFCVWLVPPAEAQRTSVVITTVVSCSFRISMIDASRSFTPLTRSCSRWGAW